MSRLTERIENFTNAFEMFDRTFQLYLTDKTNETYQLAIAQGFEIVFELSWKIMKDYLQTKGIVASTPKDSIKQSFAANFLNNAQAWIDMASDRNFSSHEYNFKRMNEILDKIETIYYKEIVSFSKFVKEL